MIFFGDSVTLGVRPGVTEAQTFAHLVATSLNRTYLNKGIGGNTSSDGLARFQTDVLASNPDYLTIMFGINDAFYSIPVATYKANLLSMVAQAKAANIKPVLLTSNLTQDPSLQASMPPYIQACREAATAQAVPLIDVYAAFCEGAISPGGSTFAGWYVDTQHPGPSGHQVIADLFALPQNAGDIPPIIPSAGVAEMVVVFNGNTSTIYRASSALAGITVTKVSTGRYRLTHPAIAIDSAISGSPTVSFGGSRKLYPVTGTRLSGSVEVATVDQSGNGIDHDYISVFIA